MTEVAMIALSAMRCYSASQAEDQLWLDMLTTRRNQYHYLCKDCETRVTHGFEPRMDRLEDMIAFAADRETVRLRRRAGLQGTAVYQGLVNADFLTVFPILNPIVRHDGVSQEYYLDPVD